MLCMSTVASNGSFDLFVDNDIDLDSSLRSTLENFVKTIVLVGMWWTAQELARLEHTYNTSD